MRKLSSYLSGCISGMLLTIIIYLIVLYVDTQDREEESVRESDLYGSSSELDKQTTTSVAGEGPDSLSWKKSSQILPSLSENISPHFSSGGHTLVSIVISSIEQRTRTVQVIENSWGQSAEGFRWLVAVGAKGSTKISNNGKQQFLIARDCYNFPSNSHPTPNQLFCLLVAVYNSALMTQYKWVSISLNTTYIATEELMHLLHQYNSMEEVYMGHPASFSATERAVLGLKNGEKICSAGSGIILSWKAVKSIGPHLRHCLGLGSGVKVLTTRNIAIGDVELGKCFNRMLAVSCSRALSQQANPSSLFVSQPDTTRLLSSFITYYPLRDEGEMVSMRFYDLSRKMRRLQKEKRKIMKMADQVCSILPPPEASLGGHSNLCNLTSSVSHVTVAPRLPTPYNIPESLNDIVRWELLTDNKLFNSEKVLPVSIPSTSLRKETEFIFDKTVKFLGGMGQFNPMTIHNMYFRHIGSTGREYILDVEFQQGKVFKDKRLSLLLPSIGELVFVDANEPQFVHRTVDFIVPLSNVNSRFTEFLKMYINLCLETLENCRLSLVVYGHNDYRSINRRIRVLQRRYSHSKFRMIKGMGRFSRGRALERGIEGLPNTSLIFICDIDMIIERAFLRRCQRNAIPGRRVYYPEFFKYYNMDYVYRFTKQPYGPAIMRLHGHWATYSYGMLCIYKSDFIQVGGFDDVEGWGGEDILLAKNIMRHRLDLFRAPDPALSHRYHHKKCSVKLKPTQFANCISSRNENLADRTSLAEHVFYLEEHCDVKRWDLWSWS